MVCPSRSRSGVREAASRPFSSSGGLSKRAATRAPGRCPSRRSRNGCDGRRVVPVMSEPTVDQVLTVLRRVHERFVETFARLGDDGVTLPSYDDDWAVAQVASHLGSGTEIFRHYLDAGVNGGPAPGDDINTPIWDAWNAKEPTAQ